MEERRGGQQAIVILAFIVKAGIQSNQEYYRRSSNV